MTFRIKQKVVCVDGRPGIDGIPVPFKKGDILTICRMQPFPEFGKIGLSFEEVDDLPRRRWGSIVLTGNYDSERFRPVVDTDISIFTAMLQPTPAKVNA